MSEIDLTYGSEDWKKWRKLCTETIPGKKSALYFLNAKVRGLEKVIPMTYRAHLGMCLFAESATGIPEIDNARIKLILVPRGVGKSANITKGLPILRTLRDPDYATGIANETAELAKAFLQDIKFEFENNELLHILFPEVYTPDFRPPVWSADRIITKRSKTNPTSPTVMATGVGGTKTGVHQNEWIMDDVISQNAAEAAYRGNSSEIEATNRWIDRLPPLLKAPKRDPMIFIGCIAEDEPVLMADGTWKAIQDVEVGDFVWSRKKDLSEGFQARKVTGVWPQGKSDVVEINVAGRKVVCTADHPFRGREKAWPGSKPVWRKAEDFARENGEPTRGVLMECFESLPNDAPSECDYDFMWLAGFMWGDGWITKYTRPDGEENYCVNFAKGVHNALNRRAERLLNKYFGDLGGKCYHTGTGTRTVRMDNNEAGRRWERWGLAPGVRAPEKKIPEWVFKASWRCRRAFLHGLCSADGHKSSVRRWSLGTSSKEMAEQVHLLALSSGIRPTLICDQSGIRQAPNSPKPKWSQLYTIGLNFQRGLAETRCYGVKSVTPLPEQREVFDITVEEGDCSFIVRGTECQNTRWWEGDSYEYVEEKWGKGEERREFLWSLKLPPQKMEWEDGVVDRPAETQHIKLHLRGDVAIFKFPAIDSNGRAIFPERYNLQELQEMQEEDPVFFAGQYLLEPTAGAASVLDPSWLKTYEIDGSAILFDNPKTTRKEYVPLRELTTYISVDPAFSKKSSSARSAIPVVGTDGERLFLLEDFAERLDSEDDIAAKVLEFYLRYRPQKIFVETIVAQVAVSNAIKRRFREEGLPDPPIEEIRSHGSTKKVMRIFGMEHLFKRGIFYYHKSQYRFFNEYVAFPRAILRDILDALSFQVPEWEKVFTMTHRTQGRPSGDPRVAAADTKRVADMRKAWGPRRGRRR